MILLDSNVLIYATDVLSDHHRPSKRIVDASIVKRIEGVIVPQVLVEFVAAVTGPAMASPLTVEQASAQAASFRTQLPLLVPPADGVDEWVRVLRETRRAGRRTFDSYLAAGARSLGVTAICTYNLADFSDMPGIVAMRPEDILIPPDLP